nr:PREDICTED: histamine N-methyltransferase A-like [Latimeria chalumnae]|eukprot:XP_005997745.1 PREDICTED: histamine N-methyltransferase A-like [Latimeria chalumnae]
MECLPVTTEIMQTKAQEIAKKLKITDFQASRGSSVLLQLPSRLVLDSYQGHKTEEIKKELKKSECEHVIIPGGMTSQLRLLDISINKPMRDRLRKYYIDWQPIITQLEQIESGVLIPDPNYGEVDLKILKQLQALYPGIPIIYEVLEPNVEHISQFKATVPRTPNLQNVTFVWNQLTAEEYEKKMKENKECKKFDFIHMIHVLYYVNNFALTMKYFTSCLEKTGKLMIVILEATSGYCKFWHKYGGHLGLSDSYISSKQIVETLEEQGIPYQCTELENELDITDCSEETENGKLLLEFLTHVYRFSETVAPALKAEIIEYLHRSDCTTERAGKYILNGNTVVLMVDP